MNLITDKTAEQLGAATIGVRPEHLNMSMSEGSWTAVVNVSEHLGSDTFLPIPVTQACAKSFYE